MRYACPEIAHLQHVNPHHAHVLQTLASSHMPQVCDLWLLHFRTARALQIKLYKQTNDRLNIFPIVQYNNIYLKIIKFGV